MRQELQQQNSQLQNNQQIIMALQVRHLHNITRYPGLSTYSANTVITRWTESSKQQSSKNRHYVSDLCKQKHMCQQTIVSCFHFRLSNF